MYNDVNNVKSEENNMNHVLYNPLSNNKRGALKLGEVTKYAPDEEFEFNDITEVDLKKFISELKEDDKLILAGGDGTLSVFVNELDGFVPDIPIIYYPSGSGNDFMKDVAERAENGFVYLNDYIRDLPKMTVKGKTYRFINGVGLGIDGYCCETANRKKDMGKRCSYISIALRGFLFEFKPMKATVTVDGVTNVYENTWLVAAMKGKYFGGGCKIAPAQDRSAPDKKVTVVLISCKNRVKCLAAFSSVFSGKHVKYTDIVKIVEGKDVKVEFDSPSILQYDGETVTGVQEYSVTVE